MGEALVIGSSGGIGAALVAALESRGDRVTGLSRRADGLDVTDEASVAKALESLDINFSTVFVATGILAPPGATPEKQLDAVDPATMARTLAVNAVGPALVFKHLQGRLTDDARIGVLTARVGSIGDNAMGGWYSYRASKAAANMVVRGAAIELKRKQKQSVIVALHPGTVATPFTADYPGHKKVTPDEAARNLVSVLSSLTPEQTGGFYDYAGKEIPW